MRPTELTPEAIINAGEAPRGEGRNITGFGLGRVVGGGNPARLKQI